MQIYFISLHISANKFFNVLKTLAFLVASDFFRNKEKICFSYTILNFLMLCTPPSATCTLPGAKCLIYVHE